MGCGSAETPDLGEWTLQEEGLVLTEDLLVSETEEFYFGAVSDLDVTSDGHLVVADDQALEIKILQPDGSLAQTLGRQGEGPGEFQNLQSVEVARGDSIYAYDRPRLTVFAPPPSSELARTVTIDRDKWPPFRIRVLEEGFLVFYGTPWRLDQDADTPTYRSWRWVDDRGQPGDTVLTARLRRVESMQGEDQSFYMMPVPFGPTTQVAVGPDDQVYAGWSDSLRVRAHSLEGSSEVVARIPAEPVPVQAAERDSALSQTSSSNLRSQVESVMPDAKPAFTDLIVADDGRLWVQRPPAGINPETVLWWVLDPEAKTIREVQLPSDVTLEVVRDGRAYATTTTEEGAPAVVRYLVESAG